MEHVDVEFNCKETKIICAGKQDSSVFYPSVKEIHQAYFGLKCIFTLLG